MIDSPAPLRSPGAAPNFSSATAAEVAPWELPEELQEFLAAGDGPVIIEILDLFQQSLIKHVRDLSDSQIAADPKRLAKVLHQLKGSSAQAGAHLLRRLAAEGEEQLSAPGAPSALPEDRLDQIVIEAASVLEQVQSFRDSLAA